MPLRGMACAGAALVVMAACGNKDSTAAQGFQTSAEGVLTVAAADLPTPGFWEGPADRPSGGFELELAEALAARFDLDEVRVVEVPFSRLVAGDLGGADLALSQITPTDERGDALDFSAPYLSAPPAVVVMAGTEVSDLDEARDLRWSVQAGTTLAEVLDERIRPRTEVVVVDTQDEALAMVLAGQVDATLLDLPVALAVSAGSDGALEVAAKLDTDEHWPPLCRMVQTTSKPSTPPSARSWPTGRSTTWCGNGSALPPRTYPCCGPRTEAACNHIGDMTEERHSDARRGGTPRCRMGVPRTVRVVVLGPRIVERARVPGDHRTAGGGIPDRAQRAGSDLGRQRHHQRHRPGRPALPDVRGGSGDRPAPAARAPSLNGGPRPPDVQSAHGCRHSRRLRPGAGKRPRPSCSAPCWPPTRWWCTRRCGMPDWAPTRPWRSAVGATVLTDTLALVVLAAVAGTETGSGSSAEIALTIAGGVAVLVAASLILLPRLAGLALRTFGTDRATRYLVAVSGFLAAATLSEVFGIEGIVWVHLRRTRPQPPRAQRGSHDRSTSSSFGSAVFIPVFLVSVGSSSTRR